MKTKNEFIADFSAQAYKNGFWGNHLDIAIQAAEEMEQRGVAPWKDTTDQSIHLDSPNEPSRKKSWLQNLFS
jgi:hypothetical protein